MQQCAEGWHRTEEIEPDPDATDEDATEEKAEPDLLDDDTGTGGPAPLRRIRSTRRRDVVDLPRVPAEDRTIGQAFATPDGRSYRALHTCGG